MNNIHIENTQLYYTKIKHIDMELHRICFLLCPNCSGCSERHEELHNIVDDFDSTEDGEAGEEAHGTANEAELGLQGHLHIPLYLVVGGGVKVDLD